MNAPPRAPDTGGCVDKPPGMACFADSGKKGLCTPQELSVPDFSQPGPPRFEQKTVLVCVVTPSKYSPIDYVGFTLGAFIVMGLVVYNVMRKKTLADYD